MTSCTRTSPCWWISGPSGPYCRRIAPAFDKVGEQYADTLIAGKINYDEEPQRIERFGIDTIPTLMLFKSGEVIGSVVAPAPKPPLRHLSGKRWRSEGDAAELKEPNCTTRAAPRRFSQIM